MSNNERPLQTRPLGEDPTGKATQPPERVQLTDAVPTPWSVRLIAPEHAIPIQLKIDDRAVIGRQDPGGQFSPEIDLIPYGAVQHGVSRRHAEVRAGQDYLVIIDRNSTNGTRINGALLQPNEPYRLRHGDRLGVGTLELEVFVSMMPVHDGVKRLNKNISQLGRSDDEEKDYDRRRVLIVEPDRETATTLRDMIANMGYEVHVALNAGEALRAVASELPDCLFVELDMPDSPVHEIARHIKQDLSSVHVPIFVISERPQEDVIRAAFDAGADVYLSKPLGVDEVVSGLREYVGDAVIRRSAG
jgi:CheY-like chemotaxis protein